MIEYCRMPVVWTNTKHGKWFEPRGISYFFAVIIRARVESLEGLLLVKSPTTVFLKTTHPVDHAKQITNTKHSDSKIYTKI